MNPTFVFYLFATVLLLGFAVVLVFLSLLNRFETRTKCFFRRCALIVIVTMVTIPVIAYPRLLERTKSPADLRELKHHIASDGTILQSTPYTCAPAALANLAQQFGIVKTEHDSALLCGTSVHGTLPPKMVRAMERLGFDCDLKRIDSREFRSLRSPAILFVDHPATGSESHAIVYLGTTPTDAGQFNVIDPLRGKSVVGSMELELIFHGSVLTAVQR